LKFPFKKATPFTLMQSCKMDPPPAHAPRLPPEKLVPAAPRIILWGLKAKSNVWLMVLFVLLVAVSRWPGLIPPGLHGFSVVYGFVFCAGVYLSPALAWWLPLTVMVVTDVALNFYYQATGTEHVWDWAGLASMLPNYLGYAGIIGLGRLFKPDSKSHPRAGGGAGRSLIKFLTLLGGGVLGALFFYLITNTATWFLNPFHAPEYTKTLSGWLIALIKGTNGWPQTWEFFRNTLLSGGLFTGLFVAAHELTAAESPADKEAGVRADDAEPKAGTEEAGV
jgi:hypothetical protein